MIWLTDSEARSRSLAGVALRGELMPEHRPDNSMEDPLIDEFRAIRRAISERFDNDVDKLIDHLQHRQREHADRVVSRRRSVGTGGGRQA